MSDSLARPPLVVLRDLAAAGDDRALRALLARLRPAIAAAARSWGSAAHGHSEDEVRAVAEARIARNLASCRGKTDAEIIAWGSAAARTAVLDLVRSRYAREGGRLVQESEVLTPPGDLSTAARNPSFVPVLECLEHAHARLPARTQAVLWLRLIEGLRWGEIARSLGFSAAAAKRRYQRAIERLRREVLTCISTLPREDRVRALEILGPRSSSSRERDSL